MKKAPKQIMGYIDNPSTWDKKAFETAIRNEVELSSGELSPTQELLIGMLVMTVQTLLDAHCVVSDEGYIYKYNAGEAVSAHMKVRTECLDKCIKIMRELDIAKVKKLTSDVDELFTTA
jgi:hypothetical protein